MHLGIRASAQQLLELDLDGLVVHVPAHQFPDGTGAELVIVRVLRKLLKNHISAVSRLSATQKVLKGNQGEGLILCASHVLLL